MIIIMNGVIDVHLAEIMMGERVTIENIPNHDPLLKRRLIALGCFKGSEVCLKQKCLFGGPCLLETQGQSISIRQTDAAKIRVIAND